MSKVQTNQIQLTGGGQQLDPADSTSTCVAYTIRAPLSNTEPAFVGGNQGVAPTTGHQLDPGDSITYKKEIQNGQPIFQNRLSDFWVIGSTGDVITWLALA